jgi:hypothetical protein
MPRTFLVILTLLLSCSAWSAEVSAGLTARETSIDRTVMLQIAIENAGEYVPPEIPEIPGLAIEELSPSRNTSVDMVKRTTHTSIILRYNITPTRAGVLTIPALTLTVDGEPRTVGPFNLTVKSAGPLLIVEVIAAKSSVYVGEPLPLTLRVLVKPFREPRLNRTLTEADMWDLLDLQNSKWGGFESVLRDLGSRDQRPSGKPQVRAFDAATNETYYAYDLRKTVWPRGITDLGLGEINVTVKYPTGLQQEFIRLAVTGIRTVTADAVLPQVQIKPLPVEGRPAEFRGAVGTFTLAASAKPDSVVVGEPVTLTITINDRTPGGADLASLPPPPLADDEALTRDFRMPSDPLAGEVSGRVKTFLQTIRPLRETVTAVPPIRFAYFDPVSEQFTTIASDQIPLQVRSAQKLAASEIVDSGGPAGPQRVGAGLTEVAGGIRANITDANLILAQHDTPSRSLLFTLLLIPPAAYIVSSLMIAQRNRHRRDPSLLRRRNALTLAKQRIGDASKLTPAAQATAIFAALSGYIGDRLVLPPGAITRSETIDRLAANAIPTALLNRIDALLHRSEQAQFAGPAATSDSSLINEASALLDELARHRLTPRHTAREVAA